MTETPWHTDFGGASFERMESSSYHRKVDSSLSQSDLIQVESNPLDAACAGPSQSYSENIARFSVSWSAWLSAREEACLIPFN